MIGEVRQSNGRKEKKLVLLLLMLTGVKNTDTAQEKGYDAGKKVSGIKRYIAVDTQGLPHAIHMRAMLLIEAGPWKCFHCMKMFYRM